MTFVAPWLLFACMFGLDADRDNVQWIIMNFRETRRSVTAAVLVHQHQPVCLVERFFAL